MIERGDHGERRAPTSRAEARAGRPILQPVDLAGIDIAEAGELLSLALDIACPLVGGKDAYPIEQLGQRIIGLARGGIAANGLELDKLCTDTKTTRSKIDAHLGDDLLIAVDLALRFLQLIDGRRVFYEELYSMPVRSRPSKAGLGADHVVNASATLRLAGLALAAADRHVAAIEIPLTTGTRDDRTCERADAARIAGFEDDLGCELPATPAEHVKRLLVLEDESRRRLRDFAPGIPDLVRRLAHDHGADHLSELADPGRLFDFMFPDLLIAAGLPVGVPTSRRRTHASLHMPGTDEELVAAVRDAGRTAVLYRGPLHSEISAAALTPADLAARGLTRIEPRFSRFQQRLGVTDTFGVEWWYSRRQQRLVRRQVAQRPASAGVVTEDWQLVGLEEHLSVAAVMVERRNQGWQTGCLQRAGSDCSPGLIKVRKVAQEQGLRALLRLCNAALVAADRRAKARAARA